MSAQTPTTLIRVAHDCGWAGTYQTPRGAKVALARHSCTTQQRLRQAVQAADTRERAIDRTPKPCNHKKANHQHGTYACYQLDHCRCHPCVQGRADYDHTRARAVAYGRENLVPPDKARAHLAALAAAGIGRRTIAAHVGVPDITIFKIATGRRRRITRTVEAKILAANPEPAPGTRTNPLGTQRRLQALAAAGWSVNRVAETTGLDRQPLDHALNGRPVTHRVARTITAFYDRTGGLPPTATTPADKRAIAHTRARATAAGWAPPAAWDDDQLDNPRGRPARWRDRVERHHADLDEYAQLLATGEHPTRAAQRLGVTPNAIEQAARRQGRTDILTRGAA